MNVHAVNLCLCTRTIIWTPLLKNCLKAIATKNIKLFRLSPSLRRLQRQVTMWRISPPSPCTPSRWRPSTPSVRATRVWPPTTCRSVYHDIAMYKYFLSVQIFSTNVAPCRRRGRSPAASPPSPPPTISGNFGNFLNFPRFLRNLNALGCFILVSMISCSNLCWNCSCVLAWQIVLAVYNILPRFG